MTCGHMTRAGQSSKKLCGWDMIPLSASVCYRSVEGPLVAAMFTLDRPSCRRDVSSRVFATEDVGGFWFPIFRMSSVAGQVFKGW